MQSQQCDQTHWARNQSSFKFHKIFQTFSWIPFFTAEVEVVGKRLNRGSSYGLEISVRYHFDGQEKIVQDSSGCAIAD